MAEMYAVKGSDLTAIADAIRLKRDSTAPIEVADMAHEIGLIDGGGGIAWAETMSVNGLTDGGTPASYGAVWFDFPENLPRGSYMTLFKLKDVSETDATSRICPFGFVTVNNDLTAKWLKTMSYTRYAIIDIGSEIVGNRIRVYSTNSNNRLTAGRTYEYTIIPFGNYYE